MDQFWSFWQHLPEKIDPVIFQIGHFKLQYYGLMYIIGFSITYFMVLYRIKHEPVFKISLEHIQGFCMAIIIGLLIGARLGYVLFYNFSYYSAHLLEIIMPFKFSNGISFTGISGMSYHGGLIGAILGTLIYVRKYKLDYWKMADLFVPVIPLGYTFGRLGNFINGELYGRVTTAPYGMYFPLAGDFMLRHPSQLYEAFLEGVVLFCVLWILKEKQKPPSSWAYGSMLAIFLILYGIFRIIIELFREPDAHLGFLAGGMTMGQLLSSFMIIGSIALFLVRKKQVNMQ